MVVCARVTVENSMNKLNVLIVKDDWEMAFRNVSSLVMINTRAAALIESRKRCSWGLGRCCRHCD